MYKRAPVDKTGSTRQGLWTFTVQQELRIATLLIVSQA